MFQVGRLLEFVCIVWAHGWERVGIVTNVF